MSGERAKRRRKDKDEEEGDDAQVDVVDGGEEARLAAARFLMLLMLRQLAVDIEFFDPAAGDFHALRTLLANYVDPHARKKGTPFDCGDLVELVIGQPRVGTVLRIGAEIFGLITVLNVQQHSARPSMQAITRYILRKCPTDADRTQFRRLLAGEDGPVGLILSERLVNVPGQVAGPLHQALFDEIAWATEDEPTAAECDAFRFKHYVVMTRAFVPADSGEGTDEATFYKPEDSVFLKESHASFMVNDPPNPERSDLKQILGGAVRQYRFVMAFDAAKVPRIRRAINALVEYTPRG